MVRIDSITLKLPTDAINGIDYNKLPKGIKEREDGREVKNVDVAKGIDYGLNRIQVDNLQSSIIIDLSAKILKDNYKQSICLDTVTQLTDEINSHGIINVNSDTLLQSTVLKCDPVETIPVSKLSRTINSVVQFANMNSSYDVDYFTVKGSLGYSANRKVKSYKERQTGYSKLHDLSKDKYNRDFAVKYPNMVKSFGVNDLRIECNLTSFKQLKEKFAVASNTLGSILNSTKNVNSDVFERIINTGVQMDLFSDYFIDMNMTKLVKEYGYNQIFRMFDYDWDRVQRWIRMKYPRTKTRNSAGYQIKQFKSAFARQHEMKSHINTDIQQVSELLKSA